MKRLFAKLFSHSNILFGSRLAGAGVVFLAQAAVARFWGAEALGNFLLFVAAANIVAVLMPLGFETTGTFFAAEYRAAGNGRHLRGFMKRSYGHVAIMAVLLLVVGYPLAGLIGAPGQLLQAHWLPVMLIESCHGAGLLQFRAPRRPQAPVRRLFRRYRVPADADGGGAGRGYARLRPICRV